MVWSTGDGVRLTVLRLNVDANAAWWLARGQAITRKRDTGGFWAVAVPIG